MEIIFIAFLILSLHYIYFLQSIYKGLNKLDYESGDIAAEKVTVIIPFRNESQNILKSLESISNLEYAESKLEIIYVDDFSEDDSFKKICQAEKKSNVKILSVPDGDNRRAFKKQAINYAINNSSGEIIVLTDCDCIHNKEWLKTLVSEFNIDTDFISGPVVFTDSEKIFNKIQKLEFASLVLVGAGLIGSRKPVICNSANLAFKRSAYNSVKGFNDIMHLSSGDDELLMQKIARDNPDRIKFCYHAKAVVITESNQSIMEFFQQRKRWASKSLFYKSKNLVVRLILIYLFYISIAFSFIAGLFSSASIMIFGLMLLIKIIPEFMILIKGVGFLFDKKLLWIFFITELLHVPYILLAGLAGLFGNFNWKNRKIKR